MTELTAAAGDRPIEVEQDRSWLGLTGGLRGDENKAFRDAIKSIGFRFAKQDHTLPSGKVARWGHSCTRPLPNKFKGKGGKQPKAAESDVQRDEAPSFTDDQLLAALG